MSPEKKLKVSEKFGYDSIRRKIESVKDKDGNQKYEFSTRGYDYVHPDDLIKAVTSPIHGSFGGLLDKLRNDGTIHEDGSILNHDFSGTLQGGMYSNYRKLLRGLGLVNISTRFEQDNEANLTDHGKFQKQVFEDIIQIWLGKKPLRKWET